MRLGILYSGGKDSNIAMYKAYLQGHEIACLITIIPASDESMLFHYPNVMYTSIQAECLGIPLISSGICSSDDESSLEELLTRAKERFAIDGIVTGAIASKYQYYRFASIASRVGLKHVAPCYGEDQLLHMKELLANNITVMITSVSAYGLDVSMLGRLIDAQLLPRLRDLSIKYGFNISFEGGEAETFVLDMPLFRKRIAINGYTLHWDGVRGHIEFTDLSTEEK